MINNEKQTDTHHEQEEFLVFSLGEENYGINILEVQEIRRYANTTKLVS